ncbi:MAG: pentapeptide repeat-containing protein [Candidatus Microthrix parvicella]|nr:pentapeptide repeat-containing protein [Candidatus Microthrix sp.]
MAVPVLAGDLLLGGFYWQQSNRLEDERSARADKRAIQMMLYSSHDASLMGIQMPGEDLSSLALIGRDLSRANLSMANLSEAGLAQSNLSCAALPGADLSGADLSGADLSGADLSGADLSGADLSGAMLVNSDLSHADLTGAVLVSADLRGSRLDGATVSMAILFDALVLEDALAATVSAPGLEPIRPELVSRTESPAAAHDRM